MKTAQPKPHIVESQVAIDEGNSVTSLCGVLIRRTRFITPDEGVMVPGSKLNESPLKGICADCLKVRTFRYLAVERVEAE